MRARKLAMVVSATFLKTETTKHTIAPSSGLLFRKICHLLGLRFVRFAENTANDRKILPAGVVCSVGKLAHDQTAI